MRPVRLFLLASGPLAVFAKASCPVNGPLFPLPKNLRDHPRTKAVANELDSILQRRIKSNSGYLHYSYVIQGYSTYEGVLWQQKYTSPSLLQVNTTGVSQVDENTVHRVGSITKAFTVLTFLSQIGESIWHEPITKYLPELRSLITGSKSTSRVYHVDWEEITVGSLATFYSGLMRDYSMLGELTEELPNWREFLPQVGYPPLPADEVPPCGKKQVCSKKEFLAGVANSPPFHASYQTNTYNNIAFVLLSYVAEAITGRPFMQLIDEAVIQPLNLKHTFITPPNDSYGVIPGDREETLWSIDFGNEAPTGNIATSAGDLTRLGQAIMKSTLLKPAVTRKWLKPIAFLPNPKEAVGMPWTIRQMSLGHDYQYVSAYTKGGRVGSYTTLMTVVPDLDLGWSIMASGKSSELPDGLTRELADIVSDKLLPLWHDVAREKAGAIYGGHYVAAASGLNSTLTIRTDDGLPGIGVYNWLSNGTDMVPWTVAFGWPASVEELARLRPSVRLYPTNLEEELPDGGRRVSFRAVFEDLSDDPVLNSYVQECNTWVRTIGIYGSKPIDLFVFTLDKSGRAVDVENMALRARLEKTS